MSTPPEDLRKLLADLIDARAESLFGPERVDRAQRLGVRSSTEKLLSFASSRDPSAFDEYLHHDATLNEVRLVLDLCDALKRAIGRLEPQSAHLLETAELLMALDPMLYACQLGAAALAQESADKAT